MPKLRLFRGPDPLDSDVIPFPRVHPAEPPFRLRLTDSDEAIRQAEFALDATQAKLDEARALFNIWSDDDGPRAA